MINLGLLLMGLVMAFTGLLIQLRYHMGNHGGIETDNMVLGFNYFYWSGLHRITIIFISIFMIFHVSLHWIWYRTVIRKKILAKNRQVITLSIVFILVASTGYIPWLIHLAGGSELTRKIFIEIHDKLAMVLFVYLILHLATRLKWFITAFRKLKIKV